MLVCWKRVTAIKLDGHMSKIGMAFFLVKFVALTSSTAVPTHTADPQAYFLYKETAEIM